MTMHRRDAIKTALAAVASTALAIPAPEPAAATADDLRDVLNRLDRDAVEVRGFMDLTSYECSMLAWACMTWSASVVGDHEAAARHLPLREAHARGLVRPEWWEKSMADAMGFLAEIAPDRLGAVSVTIVR